MKDITVFMNEAKSVTPVTITVTPEPYDVDIDVRSITWKSGATYNYMTQEINWDKNKTGTLSLDFTIKLQEIGALNIVINLQVSETSGIKCIVKKYKRIGGNKKMPIYTYLPASQIYSIIDGILKECNQYNSWEFRDNDSEEIVNAISKVSGEDKLQKQ